MVEKQHSFAERQIASWKDRSAARASARGYRYLRPPIEVTGQGGNASGGLTLASAAVRIALLTSVLFGLPASQLHAAVDAATVQRAIDRGIAYLRKSQNARGGWEEYGTQSCGLSALCTLALLNAGVSRDDPDMLQAMRYLRSFQPNETYSVALQTLVYCQLGAAGDLPRIRTNVDWLVRNQRRAGTSPDRIGSWDYGGGHGSGDPSNAQFAILALGAAQDRGVKVDRETFQLALDYWLRRQRDGGWSYGSSRRSSGSMTCAGIASVIICRGCLGDFSSRISGQQIRCCGGDRDGQDPVEEGLAWLGRHFSLEVNPGGDSFTRFYYLYALERVGRLSGRRFIGKHDWYREGAEKLLELQDDFTGFWTGNGPMENRDVATSFALLFLSKGKRQVVVGRLKYSDPQSPQQWQQHPDSLRQLVRHVERDWGRDLTWQTIDADGATLEDLLQTPVLVISGRRALNLGADFSERLREYIEQGGCILLEADGGDGCGDASGFESSVRRLCESWFEGARLERLPPSHPIWSAEHQVDPTAIGSNFWVYGVQACCRTAVFYVPQSLSCRWELGDMLFHRGGDQPSDSVRRQIDASIRVGENLIAYATGRELKDKLDQRVVLKGDDLPEVARGSIQLAMLALDAGGAEARRALPNVASLIAARVPIAVSAAPRPVGFDSSQLIDVPFLWMHGRTDFTLDDSQRSALREFVENGGVILGSAICGSEAFADAFRRELAVILPKAPLRTLPPDHPSLHVFGGFDVRQVTIRTPAAGGKGVSRRTTTPVLEVATVDNLIGVFFSPLDLSCALESPNSVQCPGYSTEEAAKIVANLVLYGLQQ